jgi:hypothetical protein
MAQFFLRSGDKRYLSPNSLCFVPLFLQKFSGFVANIALKDDFSVFATSSNAAMLFQ